MESHFAVPIPFRQANTSKVAFRFLEKFSGYGLRSSAITQNIRGALFDYDISIHLFNGSANLTLTAEKFSASFQNARTNEDLHIVLDCIVKSHESLFDRKIVTTELQGHLHALLPQEIDRQTFLAKNIPHVSGISAAGVIVYGKCDPWQREIRLQVDRSNTFPNGLYINWQTAYEGLINRASLENVSTACGNMLEKIGFTFA